MFDSIYSKAVTPSQFFIMAAASLVSGILFSWLVSFRIRANRRFFIVSSLIPFVVGMVLTFVNGSIGAGIAFGGAFALTRFRSAQGTSDEMEAVLITMGSGVAFGMGYIAYGVLILLVLPVLFLLFSALPIFEHKGKKEELLLRVTIPESLEYSELFDEIFRHYLESWENDGVKTTGMGSMFRLSFKIRMKNPAEEKAFIDELRTRNGNLEIAVLPYVEAQNQL
jgi:uncharacterized membrane protein